MNFISTLLANINDFLYQYIILLLLTICGFYFSLKNKFFHIKLLIDIPKVITEKTSKNNVSAFNSLMIATASKVGTGNIAGVAMAIVYGGAGSIFWMWIMAIIGAASAFAESVLAQIYKTVNEDGSYKGGPSYYIEKAFKSRSLGILFSVFLILAFAYGFNMLQANTISYALKHYLPDDNQFIFTFIIGTVIAVLTSFIIVGGIKRAGIVASIIVPIMATLYILVSVYIIIINYQELPSVFNEIIYRAFDFKSMISGSFAGSALIIGVKRGLLSNEAGMGSIPNAAAAADTSHPVKQGILQTFSVLIDTIICTATALMILLSEVSTTKKVGGISLVQEALNEHIGGVGIHFITISILLFAYTSIIGNYCYAESSVLYISSNKKYLIIFKISCIIMLILGSIAKSKVVWDFSDILMGMMCILNIIAIMSLSDKVGICLKDYTEQRKLGQNPKFKAKDKIKGLKAWN